MFYFMVLCLLSLMSTDASTGRHGTSTEAAAVVVKGEEEDEVGAAAEANEGETEGPNDDICLDIEIGDVNKKSMFKKRATLYYGDGVNGWKVRRDPLL